MRAVVDTNVVVSRFLSPHGTPARLIDLWERGAFELIVSEPLLAEYERALNYQKVRLRHGLSPARIREIVERFRVFATVVETTEPRFVIEADPADNHLLECAVAGRASYLVTGDRGPLALGSYLGIQILPPAAFVALLTGT